MLINLKSSINSFICPFCGKIHEKLEDCILIDKIEYDENKKIKSIKFKKNNFIDYFIHNKKIPLME